jgi:hypothetical protein
MRYPAHFVNSLSGKLDELHKLGGITEGDRSKVVARVKVARKPEHRGELHRLWRETEVALRVARRVRESKIGT